ncbi:MAG: hypothetical protein AUK21_00805 [Parcubacteria group bacterium CG2_30_48_51]|nr:MAG: hypothetical protein AUK21_00805 [Parcubacteria group bacterium CG2_30_48_51]
MLYLASDHRGVVLKRKLATFCAREGIVFEDLGTHTPKPVDYPDYVKKVVARMRKHPRAQGVLICGSGIGMVIAANRYPCIRASVAHTVAEAVRGKREDNTNVLVFAGDTIHAHKAQTILAAWRATLFESVSRRTRRTHKMG